MLICFSVFCVQLLLIYYHGLFCVLFKTSYHFIDQVHFTTCHITVRVGRALGHSRPVTLSL